MQQPRQTKPVTQFRGLHAMSATSVPSTAEKPKRTSVSTGGTKLPQVPKRNAA